MSTFSGNGIPSFAKFWKQALFLSTLAIGTALFVKSKVHLRKKNQHLPDAVLGDREQDYDISKIRPGFPQSKDDMTAYGRKSEFQGTADSYLTRKSGDKFSFFPWFGGSGSK